MRYLSVCSGVEAASLAFRPLGWEAAAFAEVDPFCSALLAERFPETPNLGDITAKDFAERAMAHGPFRLLVGGSPCQSFSVAGKRLGLDDPRGNLALVYLRIAYATRPAWLVFENVPGLLSSERGNDFAAFLSAATGQEVAKPKGGWQNSGIVPQRDADHYGVCWRILDAQHFGVPQRRRRVFVVGHLGDWRRAAAVLLERESLSGHPPPRRQAGAGVTRGPASGAGDGFLPEVANSCRTQDRRIGQGWNQTMVATALTAPSGKGPDSDCTDTLVAHSLRADGFDASEDGTGRGTPLVPVPIDMRQASRGEKMTNNRAEGSSGGAPGTGIGEAGDPAPTLADSHTPAVGFIVNAAESCAKQSHARQSDVARCIDSTGSFANAQGGTVVKAAMAVRRLTPRECERLQGMPDDWTLITYRGKPAADGPRYKAIGNSFAVPVVRWIGERIALVETVLRELLEEV